MTDQALPTFEDVRRDACLLLGDVEEVLRSDCDPDHGPTDAQADALVQVWRHVAAAKESLNAITRGEGKALLDDLARGER